MPIRRAQWNALDAAAQRSFLRRPAVEDDAAIRTAVLEIVADVKNRGDDALHALTARLDGVELDDLRVSREEIDAATAAMPAQAIDAIDLAIRNVRRFHEAQMPPDVDVETMPGVRCERVSRAIDAVGLYAAAARRPCRSGGRRRVSARGGHRYFQDWRGAGRLGDGVRHRQRTESGQDLRPG